MLFDIMKARKMLLRYVVIKNLTFNIVEESDLRNMLREDFHPNFQKFSHQTCRYDIIKYYTIEIE